MSPALWGMIALLCGSACFSGSEAALFTLASARGKDVHDAPRVARRLLSDQVGALTTILLLNLLAYNIMHAARKLVARATGKGWSIRRLRERVLRVPARIVVSARYATVVISREVAPMWQDLCTQLARLPPAPI